MTVHNFITQYNTNTLALASRYCL